MYALIIITLIVSTIAITFCLISLLYIYELENRIKRVSEYINNCLQHVSSTRKKEISKKFVETTLKEYLKTLKYKE